MSRHWYGAIRLRQDQKEAIADLTTAQKTQVSNAIRSISADLSRPHPKEAQPMPEPIKEQTITVNDLTTREQDVIGRPMVVEVTATAHEGWATTTLSFVTTDNVLRLGDRLVLRLERERDTA